MEKNNLKGKVNASDFSLWLKIDNSKYNAFNNKFYERDADGISRGDKITRYLETKLQFCNAHIVSIELIYNNRELMQLFKKRGVAIKMQRDSEIMKIDAQI